jgi:undecaprenyl diphosphate synthase
MPTTRIPRHIAIIMDGNGRWAQQRHRPRLMGHRAGAQAVKRSIEFCLRHHIEVLTLFAFSSENWNRPKEEVSGLMTLFMTALERDVDALHEHGVRLRFIGQRERFNPDILQKMQAAEAHTAANTQLVLCIAASYGGQQDITQAARSLAKEVAEGRLRVDDITESSIAARLALADLPAPDLFIRTGGEYRISNFLLWQLAYTELWFTETLWPDVNTEVLQQAIDAYANRERRFGLTSAQLHPPESTT